MNSFAKVHKSPQAPIFASLQGVNHAVVIGGSIAGLTAARALADHFPQVTLLERDATLAQEACNSGRVFRPGVPQVRHAHTLMPRGQAALERMFPGLVAELLANGAVAVQRERDVVFFQDGVWHTPSIRGEKPSVSCSRLLLESAIYRRVAALPNVKVQHGVRVVGLTVSGDGTAVTGVRLRSGRGARTDEDVLPAQLVLDASGRSSQAPRWLADLGYRPPMEWRIDAFVGYATRLYCQPDHLDEDWKTLYVRPAPPEGTRGGIILSAEDGRWYVTLIGIAGDYPPTDPEGFLAFARSLPTQRLYQAIKDATPLTSIAGFRRTYNRVRRYEALPRYLEGFLVCGDAARALNPIYAQGMTAAVLGGHTLAKCLREARLQLAAGDVTGLAETFQKRLQQDTDRLWSRSTRSDWDWPITEVSDDGDR